MMIFFYILSDGIISIKFTPLTSLIAFLLIFEIFYCRLKREEGGGIIIQAMAQPQQIQNMQQSIDQRPMDHDEKKMRRQIANSNERRRMQSINAGFQSLRQLLPHHEGEKLSKVSQFERFLFHANRERKGNYRPQSTPLQTNNSAHSLCENKNEISRLK